MSSAPRAYKTRGIVLRSRSLAEADRIYTLLTSERGKVDAVAKGVRRAKSQFGGRLEFMNEVDLTMHRGRNLDVIVSAELVRASWHAFTQPEAFAAASVVAEVVDALSEPDMPLPDVYELLANAIRGMSGSPAPVSLVPRFSMLLLVALGLGPPLERCVVCDGDLGAPAWMDPQHGGLCCAGCRVVWRDEVELAESDLHNLRAIAAARGSSVRAAAYPTPSVARAVEVLIGHHLGRRPKAGAHAAEFVSR